MVFWHVRPCSLADTCFRFRGAICLDRGYFRVKELSTSYKTLFL